MSYGFLSELNSVTHMPYITKCEHMLTHVEQVTFDMKFWRGVEIHIYATDAELSRLICQ